MPGPYQTAILFGPFRLDRGRRELTRDGTPVPLGGRAFDTLAALAATPGVTVSKDSLLCTVWPGLTVEENNLQVQISSLRKRLGDGWIVTVPGRGYRLSPPPAVAMADRTPVHPALADKPSIAVLPFENISSDPEQSYFADGMTGEIITALSRIRSFLVIARNSSFAYKGRAVDVRRVGRELGVRYVVEGSVRKSGDRVRIAGQLADATTGTQLWGGHVDGIITDVFALQDRVAASLIGAIEPCILTTEIDRAKRKPPGNLQAYDLVLRAMPTLWSYDRAEFVQTEQLLRQAIALAPTYALALVLLSRCIWHTISAGWRQDAEPAKSEATGLARLALAHGGDDPEVLAWAALSIGLGGGDLYGGIELAEQALALNPNAISAITIAGFLSVYAGETDKAMTYVARAERINPFDGFPARNFTAALAHFVAGRHEQVLLFTARALRAQPAYAPVLRYQTASLGLLGRTEAARQSAQALLAVLPAFTVARARAHLEVDMHNAHKVPGVVDAFCEGLRRAGIPET